MVLKKGVGAQCIQDRPTGRVCVYVCMYVYAKLTHRIPHTTYADPDKWREVMMENAKLLYATADDDKKGGKGKGREEL